MRPKKLDSEVEDYLFQIEKVAPIFFELFRSGRRNVDFYHGRQWTQQEVNNLRRQGRTPYVWNKIQTYVNNILGMQIQTRLDYSIIPSNSADQQYADIMLELVKWASRLNDLDKVETDVFLHGLLQGVAITQVRWEVSDVWGGYPAVERIPLYQMYWDATDTDWSLANARWMARVIPMTVESAKEAFPEVSEKDIQSWVVSASTRIPFWGYLTRNQEIVSYLTGSRSPDDVVWIVEYYRKHKKPTYTVVDLLFSNTEEFDNLRTAQSFLAGLIEQYSQISDINLFDSEGNELVYLSESSTNCIEQIILGGTDVIERREIDITGFPFQVYFASNVDGGVVSPVNSLIYPQQFLNRLISEWDNIVARSGRGLLTVVESLLPRDWDASRVAQVRSITAATIPVLRHDAIQQVPDHTTTPDIGALINVTQSFMMEAGGGQNILGLQENAAESGKAVRARQSAAGLSRVPLYYNLQQWKKDTVTTILWYIRNYSSEDQLRLILEDQRVGAAFEYKPGIYNTLKSIETDIAITIATDTETARQEVYNQILQMLNSGLAASLDPKTLLALLVEMNPYLTEEVKNKIYSTDAIAGQIKQQLAAQQEEQKLQKQALDTAKRNAIRKKIQPEIENNMQQ